MVVRGLVSLVAIILGVIAFVVIDLLISAVITGADTGSVILQNVLRVIVAATILISAVMTIWEAG